MTGKRRIPREEFESLLSGIAHEIRNPLNALTINTQLLLEYTGMLPEWFPKKEEMTEILESNIKVLSRLNDLVSEFLRYSRPPSPEFASTDLNGLVREVLEFVEAEFRKRGIRLKVSLADEPLVVLVDGKMVKQALLNLLLNAADALDKEEKLVEVETGKKGGRPYVSVADNGSGIGREERKKIFALFYTTKQGGSGIGLPLVRKIMETHGGKVTLRSRKRKGSRFTLVFPTEAEFGKFIRGRGRNRLLPEVVR